MADAGMQVPAMDSRPATIGFEWLWEAFADLSTCRAYGFSVGPIPWTAVQTWATVNGLNYEERYVLTEVIKHMDQVFLDHQAEQSRAKNASNKKP